jgi:hypothetical protein
MDIKALKDKLEMLSTNYEHIEDKHNDDEFIPHDWYGSNMDDAYWGGYDDGQTMVAAKLLKEFFPEAVEEK